MTRRIWLTPGLMVWLVGLSIGSLAPVPEATRSSPASATPAVPSGYERLAGDFHVHSFPGDGSLLPWYVATEARRRGLDVIALTNHNHMLEWRIAEAARRWMRADVIVLPGEEVTSPGFHLAAVGIRRPIAWSRSARDVIAAVHAAGGVAIAAHPARGYSEAYDAEALGALDGVEAAHRAAAPPRRARLEIAAFFARARAVNPTIAAIGSSDFHREAPIGLSRTYLFVRQRTEQGVLEAVRMGRTAACDGTGTVTGAEPWASLSEAACRAAVRDSRRTSARAGGPMQAFAVACALVGLTAMVFSRGRR